MEWIIHDSLLKGLSLSQTGIYCLHVSLIGVPFLFSAFQKCIYKHTQTECTQNAQDYLFSVQGVVRISGIFHKIQLPLVCVSYSAF